MGFCVYVLSCKDEGHYYVGQTNNLPRRLASHARAAEADWEWGTKSREWLRKHGLTGLLCYIPVETKPETNAMEREVASAIKANGFEVNGVGWHYSP